MADELTDPAQETAPLPWQTVTADPAFRAAAPEDKLVAFSRWHDQAYNFAKAQPDWAAHEANFNQSASEIQDELSKAAGGLTPELAAHRVGEQAVAAAGATNGQQVRDALRPYGPDVWKAYLDNRTPAADETILGNVSHELVNAGREMEAHIANAYAGGEALGKNIWGNISDQVFGTNIATPEKHPDTLKALYDYDQKIQRAQQTLEAMPPDHPDYERVKNEVAGLEADRQNFTGQQNAKEERFANAVSDLHNTLANIDPEFHVDPTLKNALSAKLGGVVGDIAPAFTPGVGLPILLAQSGINSWAQKYDQTGGDTAAADAELAKSTGINLLFMGLAHGTNSLLTKALGGVKIPVTAAGARAAGPAIQEAASPLTSLAVRVAGGSAANVVIGQAIAGAEAAADAKPGDKFAAFAKAFNTPEGSQMAQAIGFGILGAGPIDSMKAAAAEAVRSRTPAEKVRTAENVATTVLANNLENSNSPQTADVVRQEAIGRRADALRQAMSPELQAQARAAGAQENFVEGTFPEEAAPKPPAIKLTSNQAVGGEYAHNLEIAPETTTEQLQAWQKQVDLSHLPPEAQASVKEQIDQAIKDRSKPETAAKAATPPIFTKIGIVDAAGKVIAEGPIEKSHEGLMQENKDNPEVMNAFIEDQGNTTGPQRNVFIDNTGKTWTRADLEAAGLPIHSQDLQKLQRPAAAAAERTYNEAPLPTAAEVARMAARTPEEKAKQIEEGTAKGLAEAEATGLAPTTAEAHRTTGDAAAGKKLRAQIDENLKAKYPEETLPEGTTEIPSNPKVDKSPITGDILRFAKDEEGKIRPVFTNDPQNVAEHLDNGTRVVVPDELVTSGKVNPAIKYEIDPKTGEYVATATDVKLPDGKVIHVDGPDQFSEAYTTTRIEQGKTAAGIYRFTPEEMAALQEKIQKGAKERGLELGDLHLELDEIPHDAGEISAGTMDAADTTPPDSAVLPGERAPTDLATRILDNATAFDRMGILKPEEVKNPMRAALTQISKDTRLSPGHRLVAKVLLKTIKDWSKVQLKVTKEPNANYAGLHTSGATPDIATIILNMGAYHGGGGPSSTLLHEAVHHATIWKVDPRYKRNAFEQKAFDSIKKLYDKALASAFEKATGNKGSPIELKEFAREQAGENTGGNYVRANEYYGISNLREFVSEALTSPDFQKFLSGIEGEGAVGGKIGNALNAILGYLKQLFVGEPIKKGSLLDNALNEGYKLLRDPQEVGKWEYRGLTPEEVGKGQNLADLSRPELEDRAREMGVSDEEIMTMTRGELAQSIGGSVETKAPTTKTIPDNAYGWLGPDGKFQEAGNLDHEGEASGMIAENPKLKKLFNKEIESGKLDPQEPGDIKDFMMRQGYVRVAGGPGDTTTYIQGKPTASQLRVLKEAAITKGSELIHEILATGKDRTIYSPSNTFKKTVEPTKPELTHETDETGKTIHDIRIPEGTTAEDLRGAAEAIAKSSIPTEDKVKLTAIVGQRLESFKTDVAANRYATLQDQIAKQPEGATPEQSAELEAIKAAMPEVVDHPQVQRSAQALGIVPGYLDINDRLATHFHAATNWLNTVKPANWWAAWYNAAETKAVIFAKQKANDVRGTLREVMNRKFMAPTAGSLALDIVKSAGRFVGKGPKLQKNIERDERALTFVVEAQNNPANLDVMRQKIKTALATPGARSPMWYRKANQALDAIDHAEANFGRLSIAADEYTKNMQDQVRLENANGIATNYRNGYVPHIQDMATDPDTAVLFSSAGGTGGLGFKKARSHPTFADSLAAGVTPKTLNALDAMENRLKRGVSSMGKQAWAEAGRAIIDPVSNQPLVTDVITTKHPQTGDTQTSAPPGYQLKLMGNRQIAVHQQYSSLYDAFTRPSAIRESKVGSAALATAGLVKHGLLLFDTFHLGRLGFYQGAIRGKATFSKGLLTLDYSNQELQNMERRGQLPKGITSADLIARKDNLQMLIDQGYNLGGIQEAINAGFTRKIPFVGDFNKFVFEQFQRGGMAESGLSEFERQKSAFPELTDVQVARKVAKELNTRFGNLKKEGWLRSDTLADLANLVFLAPHWNEGLLKSEFGAATQLAKAGKDLTLGYKDQNGQTQRALRAGALLKGSGTLLLGTFALNQIINYATRGQPTWQNPEEGLSAKISAYIPDKIGGGPGFFLNPFTLPGEITHQILEQKEKGLNTFEAIAKVAGYKASPLAHVVSTAATQTDRFDRPLYSPGDVMMEMVNDLAPVPIFGSALYHGVKSLGEGKVTEPYKGAIEKQIFSTGGIKLSSAPSDAARMGRLAKEYLHSIGAEKPSRYTGSDYQKLRDAVLNNDPQRAQSEYTELLKTKTAKQINTHFKDQVHTTFTGSKKHEAAFRSSLNPEQQKAYDRAIDARYKLRQAFFDLNLTEH